METPPWAAVSQLELEPTRRVDDDEGWGVDTSADVAAPTIEEAPLHVGG